MKYSILICIASLLLAGCASYDPAAMSAAGKCLLLESHERDGKESVALQFEALDGQRLGGNITRGAFYDGAYGFKADTGEKRVMIRVYTRGLEGRHEFKVPLKPGHRYRVTGEYGEGYGKYFVRDADTNERLTESVSLSFSRVSQGGYVPIFIPTK